MTRDTGTGEAAIKQRVPCNAPARFNLGAREFTRLFDDGRVELDPDLPGSFRSPADALLPIGLDNVLAVQAMFPVTSATEMAGQTGENPVAEASAAGDLPTAWERLAQRFRAIPECVELFQAAFPSIQDAGQITFVHAANAIAAFETVFGRADQSPFDHFLRGDGGALAANLSLCLPGCPVEIV